MDKHSKGGTIMTIEELLEREAIKEVRILYSHYFDAGETDKLAALFTEDAVCEFDDAHGGVWEGRETIRENYASYKAEHPYSFLHASTNPLIRILGPDTANARWYLIDLMVAEGVENPVGLLGIYDDAYRKVDGQWLIERTRIDFLWPERTFFGPRVPL
tara:strand:- start:205 stop:681 length:477 start_codon:yes stop_codon:yes gene_type:complete